MWRAFFFAVGTMLIIMGLECLVIERFVVQDARIPGFVAQVLDGSPQELGGGPFTYQNGAGSAASPFGPSRFNDDFANQNQPLGNFYGGVPNSGQRQDTNSQFSLAGFGKQRSTIAPLKQRATGRSFQSYPRSVRPQTRIVEPKDWMPWSLLAAGSLVVLYTNTTTGRSFSND